MMTQTLTIEYPDELLWALQQEREEFEAEARLLLALKLYETGKPMEKSNRVRTNFSKADLTGFKKPVRSIVRFLTGFSISSGLAAQIAGVSRTTFFPTQPPPPLSIWRNPR